MERARPKRLATPALDLDVPTWDATSASGERNESSVSVIAAVLQRLDPDPSSRSRAMEEEPERLLGQRIALPSRLAIERR
jgi:hypothetical protein